MPQRVMPEPSDWVVASAGQQEVFPSGGRSVRIQSGFLEHRAVVDQQRAADTGRDYVPAIDIPVHGRVGRFVPVVGEDFLGEFQEEPLPPHREEFLAHLEQVGMGPGFDGRVDFLQAAGNGEDLNGVVVALLGPLLGHVVVNRHPGFPPAPQHKMDRFGSGFGRRRRARYGACRQGKTGSGEAGPLQELTSAD